MSALSLLRGGTTACGASWLLAGRCHALLERTYLVELDHVSCRVVDERLAVCADGAWVPDRDALRAELLHHDVEVRDLNCEVLTDVRRYGSFEEMDLLVSEIDPRAGDPQVWAVVPQRSAEQVGVEARCLIDITDVDGDVVDGQWFHENKSPRSDEELLVSARLSPSGLG